MKVEDALHGKKGKREPDHRSIREIQRILEEMKAVQEKIQKEVAHLIELKRETEKTFKKIKEERPLLEIARKKHKNQASQTKIVGCSTTQTTV